MDQQDVNFVMWEQQIQIVIPVCWTEQQLWSNNLYKDKPMHQETEDKEKTGTEETSNEPQAENSAFIGDYHSAPHYLKDNDQIHTGYRINFNSKRKLFKSLFMVHNESVNIWTHLLPLLIFSALMISFYLVVDDHQFKIRMTEHREEIEKSFEEYQSSLKDLSSLDKLYENQVQMQVIKNRILNQYDQIMTTVHQKSQELTSILDYDIQGIKDSLRKQLREKLVDLALYKKHYEDIIAPQIVEAIENRLDSEFLTSLKTHAHSIMRHLDSNIFSPMELHPESPNPQLVSRWPIFVFLSTAVLCLFFSTVFHLFHPLSSKTYGLLLRFDFAGISLLIAGSVFPPFYYSLYCHFAVAEIYLTCSVTAAVICFVISLFEFIHRKENMKYRAVVFGAFGFSMTVPLTHLVVNQFVFDNFGDPFRFSSSYPYFIALIMSYIIGLYIFTVKCPQRNNPGKYDICGHSHQIWHCLVVLGIVFTYFGVLQNYEMRKQAVCPV